MGNQMFQIQRKASTGHELSQQQIAYAQKYMQEFGYGKGLEFQALNQNLDLLSKQINYQNISNQMNLSNYQHYVQQMQHGKPSKRLLLQGGISNNLVLIRWGIWKKWPKVVCGSLNKWLK